MTKEEIIKEAQEQVNYCTPIYSESFIQGYLASAEPREKRITELEHQLTHRNCLDCSNHSSNLRMRNLALEKENAELRKVAEFQQSSNMSRHFENKKLKEGLAVGSTFNKALNSMNKNLEEERNKYRNMVFDLQKENAELKEKYVKNICDCDICDTYCNSQLIKAKEIIKTFLGFAETFGYSPSMAKFIAEAEQFIK